MADELEHYCNEQHLPAKTGLDIHLVLEELITNIISYGYEDRKEHTISIRMDLDDDVLTVEVEDDARPFNPLDVPPPDTTGISLDNLEPGGLGIFFVRKLTDEVSYRRENNCNILTFKKKVIAGNRQKE